MKDPVSTVMRLNAQAQITLFFLFQSQEVPKFPKVNDLSDLTDGVAITSVMSLYCSEGLPWSSIALGDPPSMADSLYNIQLLQRFCKDSLPFNVCHLSIEDIGNFNI